MPVHSLYLSRLSSEQREELKMRLFDRQSRVCFICEKSIHPDLQRDTLEIDHIIPIAGGGKDEERMNMARQVASGMYFSSRLAPRASRLEGTGGFHVSR